MSLKRFSNLMPNSKNMKVMKLGFNSKLYNPKTKKMSIVDLKRRYVFGVLGSWNKRKNVKGIVQAFCQTFSSKDNVSLLLVSKYATRPYNGKKDNEIVKKDDMKKWDIKYELDRYTEGMDDLPHIALIDIPIHENVLPNVMAGFNCLVGFSMGESTWLPGLQAMAMKKPVIQLGSDCSGFMDYMGNDNSYLCENYNHVKADDELVKGTSEYYEGQFFAKGCQIELGEKMLQVYKEFRTNGQRKKISRAIKDVETRTWNHCVTDMVKELKEIKSG